MKKIKLPVFELYPQQRAIFNAILSHKKNYAVVLAHRRWGKDFVALSTLVSYAIQNRGNYYYFAPFLSQIRDIILLGKLQDEAGTDFLDLIPDEIVKFTAGGNKANMSNMSIELTNGSIIFFRGSDDDKAQVG